MLRALLLLRAPFARGSPVDPIHRMTAPLRPGLLVLHGNRLEALAEVVFAWLREHPLGALEEEVILVQSNGMAEWLKMELATAHGICAATRVELPARFVWRAYRAVLGREAVPPTSALDKLPMTWRLMKQLPALVHGAADSGAADAAYAPVAGFLAKAGPEGGAARRWQLARRLADLFDQYQVYRSDWLEDWAEGQDVLRGASASASARPVPPEQRWQPALWRAVLADQDEAARASTRPQLHRRFLHALRKRGASSAREADPASGPASGPGFAAGAALPRRVVLFGTTHLPHQTLEAIAALAPHVQVLMAVPNPCRYHWADIIEGGELQRAARRRHPLKGDVDLAEVPPEQLHLHGHPLLAAWGRQGRDFVRQLEAFDETASTREQFGLPRVDHFDDGPGDTLLAQVQARIRDLVPLAEHAAPAGPDEAGTPGVREASSLPRAADDRSILFHVAHSAQREVEILHDQLLHLLAHPPGGQPLHPRDIVVMVPDIDRFAPAIRSVFGQHRREHPRHIPWGLADQRERGRHPLLVALEWLLRVPQQRFGFSELRDLLDVPAVAKRLGLQPGDVPQLAAWAAGAGIRWGLHAGQRAQLGLAACGGLNSWRFGLRRLLLGYATGAVDEGFHGVEPHAEVAGLAAGLAGVLAEWLGRLEAWWLEAARARPPAAWADTLRALLQAQFEASDDDERGLLAALDDALAAWLAACEAASFDEPVELAVVREAWLDAVDEPAAPGGGGRFRAGGVTFCTLLPLRAIPFEVVCLLGMNDSDYPRRAMGHDFDLMAQPGLARPGDRSRRDDDRQLMLDALLAARRVLYVSWVGRSPHDNEPQPPSVLVSQLRDYLAAGWGASVLKACTTEHPLQPFSRRYFEVRDEAQGGSAKGEGGPALFTYAAEWRAAHVDGAASSSSASPAPPPEAGAAEAPQRPLEGAHEWSQTSLTLPQLASFLRNPVKAFFAERLQVRFREPDEEVGDDELFASEGLDRWRLLDDVLQAARAAMGPGFEQAGDDADRLRELVHREAARHQRAGRLPMAGPGEQARDEVIATLLPMVTQWQVLRAAHPRPCAPQPLRLAWPATPASPPAPVLRLEDELSPLRRSLDEAEPPVWIDLQAGRLAGGKKLLPRGEKLLLPWLRCLASAACGRPARGVLVGSDVVVHVQPPDEAQARESMLELLQAFHEGLAGDRPLPTAVRTGLAFLFNPERARDTFEGGPASRGEGEEPCLARLYPDFHALANERDFEPATHRLYERFAAWLDSPCVRVEELPGHADLDEADENGGGADDE